MLSPFFNIDIIYIKENYNKRKFCCDFLFFRLCITFGKAYRKGSGDFGVHKGISPYLVFRGFPPI